MGANRQGSKGGAGYVGGFLHLFDWNVKSRKKLFPSKSDLPERLKQGKRSDANFPTTRVPLMDEDEGGAGSSIKGSSDYSCSSSVTDEDGCGTKAPSVVARLMGLDSLPTSDSMEPYSTPFFDSRDVCYQNPQIVYSGNFPNHVDVRARNKPIEKFQTEILPPKSAKSIPSTQYKLLSPIKGPGFVPTKNAAHIMEAAAKIIKHQPQTTSKAMTSLVGVSAPLKVRDMKEKLEVRSRQSRFGELSAAKYLKGQSLNKSWNGSEDSSAKENNTGAQNKGKSISLAIQAKANVERREGLNHGTSRSLVGEREQGEARPNQLSHSQPSAQKGVQKKPSTRNTSGVLRQNNQKQNFDDRDKTSPRTLISNVQGRKAVSGRHKTTSKGAGNVKTGSRKFGLEDVMDIDKGVSDSKTNNLPCKKRSIDGGFHFQRNCILDEPLTNKSEKPIQAGPVSGRHFNWAESRKKGLDVVSFSFTAPMARTNSGSEPSNYVSDKKRNLVDSESTKLSTVGFNVIGGDALSVLLEQKLKELTSRCNSIKDGMTRDSMQKLSDSGTDSDKACTMPVLRNSRDHEQHAGKFCGPFDSESSRKMRNKFLGVEVDEFSGGGPVEVRHPSPVSILEPFPTESWNSSDSIDSNSTDGRRLLCSSVQAQDAVALGCSKKFHSAETETELCDSASSTTFFGTSLTRKSIINPRKTRSAAWELEYVKDITSNLELMFQDFVLGEGRGVIDPRLYEQLESHRERVGCDGDVVMRIGRKAVFDCVRESVEQRCMGFVSGGWGAFGKGVEEVRRGQVAGEVYAEICRWRGLGKCMVDEVVESDMSSRHGRWLDFEGDAFRVGAEVEGLILSSLVDEVVADLLCA